MSELRRYYAKEMDNFEKITFLNDKGENYEQLTFF